MPKKDTKEIRFKEKQSIYELIFRIAQDNGCSVPELYREMGRKEIYSRQSSMPHKIEITKRRPMTVHTNEAERHIIHQFSQQHGLSNSSTIRRAIKLLGGGYADLLPDEIDAIEKSISALERIGRLYNQHIRLIHQGKATGIPKSILQAAIKANQSSYQKQVEFEKAVKAIKL